MSNGNVSCTFVKEFKYLNLVFVKIAYNNLIIILFLVEIELMGHMERTSKITSIKI